jgi:hypothetical protein
VGSKIEVTLRFTEKCTLTQWCTGWDERDTNLKLPKAEAIRKSNPLSLCSLYNQNKQRRMWFNLDRLKIALGNASCLDFQVVIQT